MDEDAFRVLKTVLSIQEHCTQSLVLDCFRSAGMFLKENRKKRIRGFKDESEAIRLSISDSIGSVTDCWKIRMGEKLENKRKNTFPFFPTIYIDE